ncbi:MAG: hypothetical protein ACYDC6_06365 [Acidobacteriaceae bacterium]
MTPYILGAATLIMLVLIISRRASPEFRRKSEAPKFQFLANLGLEARQPSDSGPEIAPHTSNQEKETNDKHES